MLVNHKYYGDNMLVNHKYYGDNMLVNHKRLLAVTVSCYILITLSQKGKLTALHVSAYIFVIFHAKFLCCRMKLGKQ